MRSHDQHFHARWYVIGIGRMFCRCRLKLIGDWFRVFLAGFVAVPVVTCLAEQSQFRVRRWSTDDGLPQNRTGCIKQTQDGYLWVGTWYGLVRFNGLDFTVFNRLNSPELSGDVINALDESKDGALWIGTSEGIVSYKNHQFHRYFSGDAFSSKKVWKVVASSTGGIWAQAENYVFKLKDGKKSLAWRFDLPRSKGPITHLEEDEDGWLNVVLDFAWLKLSPDATEVKTNWVRGISAGPWFTGKLGRSPNSLWVGGAEGVDLITPEGARHISRNEREHIPVNVVFEDRRGNLWIGDREGKTFIWDSRQWKSIELAEKGKGVVVSGITEDQEGSVWIGTDRGLFQIQNARARTFTEQDGLPSPFVYSVCEDESNTVWAGTVKGICRIRENRVVALEELEPFTSYNDRCVWPDQKGGVFFSKDEVGLYEFVNGHFFKRGLGQDFRGPPGALYADPSGLLWISWSEGVISFRDGRSSVLAAPFPLKDVRSMLQDREGNFWFGTRNQGVIRKREETFVRFTEKNGLANNSVWSIYQDRNGSVWFGTENGLSRFRNGKFFTYTARHGLAENPLPIHRGAQNAQTQQSLVINCILEDNLGYLWLSGLRGLLRIERAQLDAVAENRALEVECTIVDTADGMESSETNGERQPSGWKAHDGRLWFPTTQGLAVVDPAQFKTRSSPPPMQIEQVLADDEVLYGDFAKHHQPATRIRLPAGRAKLMEFYFTANTLIDSQNARFRYRLQGVDKTWRDLTIERVARYTNLRPNQYIFEVKASDRNGAWNRDPARFSFSLAPHLWERWQFYLFCAFGVIGLGAAVQAYRLRWDRRLHKLEEQRALANERARIARDLHDDLGSALTGLALELDVVGRQAEAQQGIVERLTKSAIKTRQMAERMREVVWSVNPKCDTLSSLASFLDDEVTQFLNSDAIDGRFEFPQDLAPLVVGAEARHQLALSVREALTNVVRHAKATEVVLSLSVVGNHVIIQIKDNGQGFDNSIQKGHGLENIQSRILRIGGTFECISKKGGGTMISFRIPASKPSAV